MTRGWLIGGAAFLAALLVASVIVVLVETETQLEEGTAEAAVQGFLKAVETDDFKLAYSFLSKELKADCPLEEFFGGSRFPERRLKGDRITLEDTTAVGDAVFVTVRVTSFQSREPFGPSESSFEQRFTLVQDEGEWRFTDYPWPFFRCGAFEPVPAEPPLRRPPEPIPTPAPAR